MRVIWTFLTNEASTFKNGGEGDPYKDSPSDGTICTAPKDSTSWRLDILQAKDADKEMDVPG